MRLATSFLFLLIVCGGSTAGLAASRSGSGLPSLTLPDDAPGPLPPGAHAFGPQGPVLDNDTDVPSTPPDQPPSAQHEAEQPKPSLSPREQRKQRLDELFDRLAKAKDPIEAKALSSLISESLDRSGSDTADLLMLRAVTAMDAKQNATATALLDKIITLQPGWAEAWNKRATVRYLEDDDVGAMADIGHVLALEPRHFGALSGMGFILHRNGDDKAALTVLRRAEAVNPQDETVKTMVDTLTPDVEGREL